MPDEQFIPNQASNKEPAQGARESTPADPGDLEEAGRDEPAQEDLARQAASTRGSGISNRSLDEEKREQREVPPRNTRGDARSREGR